MIKINSVTTKSGDCGKTICFGWKTSRKYDEDVEFIGNLDELNCHIGNILKNIGFFAKFCTFLYKFIEFFHEISEPKILLEKKFFEKLQHDLFEIGKMFLKKNDENCENLILEIEKNIEILNKNLPELKSFLLQNGNNFVISLHFARVSARKTERTFWKFFDQIKKEKNDKEIEKIQKIGVFLNRLSDLIFVMIRRRKSKMWIQKL